MLLKIVKFGANTRVFNSITKDATIFPKNNFVRYPHFSVVVLPKHQEVQYIRSLRKPSFFNYYYCAKFCNSAEKSESGLDRLTFETVCTETLDSISEYFEELVESVPHLKNADVMYSDGVLTVNLGKNYGTYVINRQTPNLQIWLSSPTSGPKRYDFIGGTWVYKHDKSTLHSLLDREIKEIVNKEVQFVEKCSYAKANI